MPVSAVPALHCTRACHPHQIAALEVPGLVVDGTGGGTIVWPNAMIGPIATRHRRRHRSKTAGRPLGVSVHSVCEFQARGAFFGLWPCFAKSWQA